jgi:hypothetical protein
VVQTAALGFGLAAGGWLWLTPVNGGAAETNPPPQFREGSRTDPAINPIPRRYEWPNDPPADGPFERSKDIRGVVFTGRYANYTGADTWYFQGAPDGHQYSCWTDGEIDGFRCNSNIRAQATGQARIEGNDPLNLKIVNLGRLTSGANYYPCVSLIADGVFYIGVYSAFGDAGHYFKGFRYARDWSHFTDRLDAGWRDPHWTDATDPDGNFFGEQGQARFRVLHTVNFGRTNSVAPDGKIYFSAHGFSRGNGRNDWDKGDAIYLCRVPPGPDNVTRAATYEFFAGRDDAGAERWSRKVEDSRPVLDWPNHLGSEGITHVPGLNKFILITCRLKETETNLNYNVTIFWEADRVTGPYRLVHYLRDFGPQTYFPNLPAAFIAPDGRSAWLCVSCNYSVPEYRPHQCRYAASLHEIRFDVAGGELPPEPEPGRNIAREAKLAASSFEPGTSPTGAVDGVISGEARQRWACQEGPGSFLRLEWDAPRTIHKVRIWDNPAPDAWTQEGYLTFDDGTIAWMHAPPSNRGATPAEINFPARSTRWLRSTITKGIAPLCTSTATEPGPLLGVAEIEVFAAGP